MVEAKLYIKEIKRIIPGNIIDYDKTIKYLVDNILIDCKVLDANKKHILFEILDDNIVKSIYNKKTFWVSKNKKYGVFNNDKEELYILFQ